VNPSDLAAGGFALYLRVLTCPLDPTALDTMTKRFAMPSQLGRNAPGRSVAQTRWGRSRFTVPDTPLSSTGPMSTKAIPFSVQASATAWLTSTSAGRA
jgi:hypothetical protein